MKPKVVITTLEGVATTRVEIQSRAPGHEDLLLHPPGFVVDAFQVVAPIAVFVELVEPQRRVDQPLGAVLDCRSEPRHRRVLEILESGHIVGTATLFRR